MLAFIFLVGMLASCQFNQSDDQLPTLITTDLNEFATQSVKTQNAPPPRFRNSISYPEIDKNLETLGGWRYIMSVNFDGVFAGTTRTTRALTRAEVWYNELGIQRRVVLEAEGEIFGRTERETLEGVRLGDDTYLVQNPGERGATCAQTNDTPGAAIADFGAGDLIGGVRSAVPVGLKQLINSEEVYRYEFLEPDLILPNMQIAEGGRVLYSNGELWFSAEHEAIVRFYLTVDVENAIVFDSQLPVTGTLIIQYDLYDIGTQPNISIPFGC